MEPGWGSARGRGEWLQGLERAEPRPGFRAPALSSGLLSPPAPERQKPPTNHRPQHHRIKYTDIFIVSKGPQSGEEAPPRQPRPEEGLKTPKSTSRPCRNLPKSSPGPHPQMSVPLEYQLSVVCARRQAPFQRGPQSLELWKDGVPPEFLIDAHLSNLSNSGWVTLGESRPGQEGCAPGQSRCGVPPQTGPAAPTPARDPHAAVWMWNVGVQLPHAPSAGSRQARRA